MATKNTELQVALNDLKSRRSRRERGSLKATFREASSAVAETAYALKLVAEIATTNLETSLIEARLEQSEELSELFNGGA